MTIKETENQHNDLKNKIAIYCVIFVLVFSSIYLFVPWIGGYNWLAWLLAIFNLIAGPVALIGYIIEIRKGIFDDVEEIAKIE